MRDRIAQAIRAFHGSPHSFDKFDASKIGSGEGAQTYGRGLYFAGNEDVARSYRDTLAPAMGKLPDDVISMSMDPRRAFMAHAAKTDVDPLTAAKRAQYMSTQLRQEDVGKLADLMEQTRRARQGHMYEVNINAKPEAFLNFDAPIAEQAPNIQAVFDKFDYSPKDKPPFMLNDAANQLAAREGSWSTAAGGHNVSAKLSEAGVPGIRYLDQGSRGAGQGTSNYVVFDPGIVDIMRKYGVAGAAPVGMGALAAQDQYGAAP